MSLPSTARAAIDAAKARLHRGHHKKALTILVDAAEQMLGGDACDWCERDITGPAVRDPEWVAWLGDSAPPFCSKACLDAHDEHRQNADGNTP